MHKFTTRPEIIGNFGVVTTTHWIASAVGMSILEKNGNAFDAAVATGFTLQVGTAAASDSFELEVGGDVTAGHTATTGANHSVGAPTIAGTAANHIYAANQANKVITSGVTVTEVTATTWNTTDDIYINLAFGL